MHAARIWEEAADRVGAEARRLDDLAEDIRRRIRDLHWSGHNADYFCKHAAYQAVRAVQNRDVVESLRVLLLRAAAEARAAATKPHHCAGTRHAGELSGGAA